jgi:hypothetical protein
MYLPSRLSMGTPMIKMANRLALAAQKSIEKISKFSGAGKFKFETVLFEDPEAEVGLFMLTPNISFASFPGNTLTNWGVRLKKIVQRNIPFLWERAMAI